jgi:TolB-like protein/lysozyme family protein
MNHSNKEDAMSQGLESKFTPIKLAMPMLRTLKCLLLLLGCASATMAAPDGLRVAVMKFECGKAAEMEDIGSALQAMIITDLSAVPSLRLIERARLKDILAEQDLGMSGAVDPKTAPRLGKLLGASHILVGNCTVVGGKMRMDTRLIIVQSGRVLLAEMIEGDKEAFFELQKDLVNKLIASLDVKLAPKERAQVAHIHTADYQAFRQFGEGLRLHDDKKYDQAIQVLREATTRDKDFKLAALTLDEYQRLIAQIQTRSEDILVAQRDLERIKQDKAAAAELALVQKLESIAADRGASKEQRLTALHSLGIAMSDMSGRGGRLYNLRRLEDRYAMQRNGDVAASRYVAEALASFPLAPLTLNDSNYSQSLVENPQDFDKEFAYAIKKLLRMGDIDENRKSLLIDSTSYVNETAERLHMDARQSVAFHQQLFDLSLKLSPSDYHVSHQSEELAKAWRSVLELDKSTAIYTELSRKSDNPWRLKGLASEIERNRDLTKLLSEARQPALMREYLLLNRGVATSGIKDWFWTDGKPSDKALKELTRLRSWPHGATLWVGDQPAWTLGSDLFLGTGPRTDFQRCDELRHFRVGRSPEDPDALVFLGATPRRDFNLSFKWLFQVPDDFKKSQSDSAQGTGRPDPSFLFGITDVDCEKQEDPATQKSKILRPMKALAVVFSPKAVQLVEITEVERDMWHRKTRFDEKVIGSSAVDLSAKTLSVSIRVAGDRLHVETNGKGHDFKLPAKHLGFTGLRFHGEGYAAISNLKGN